MKIHSGQMLLPFDQLQGNYLYFGIMDLREKLFRPALKEHKGMQLIDSTT